MTSKYHGLAIVPITSTAFFITSSHKLSTMLKVNVILWQADDLDQFERDVTSFSINIEYILIFGLLFLLLVIWYFVKRMKKQKKR